jgi:hypothetical protein
MSYEQLSPGTSLRLSRAPPQGTEMQGLGTTRDWFIMREPVPIALVSHDEKSLSMAYEEAAGSPNQKRLTDQLKASSTGAMSVDPGLNDHAKSSFKTHWCQRVPERYRNPLCQNRVKQTN